MDIYSRILNDERLKRLGFLGRTYVDIFAGSGVNRIGKKSTPIAGSSPIAARFHCKGRAFSHYIAVEKNPIYAKALEQRMNNLVGEDKISIIQKDANEALHEVLFQIEETNNHYMAFIDYEGAKGFSWASMEELLKHRGDLWITFCSGLRRTLGRSEWSIEDRKTLSCMVGEDVVESSRNEEELYTNYSNKIRKYRPHVIPIMVSSGKGYHYLLLFATRKTWNDSPYISAVQNLKERIERLSGTYVETVTDIIEGLTMDITTLR